MVQQVKEKDEIIIGCRIAVQSYRGTVRYYGPVDDREGNWLGVDWDDATRGKNNGTHNGVKYFTTSSPSSGSFVRPDKVDFGCTFTVAVRNQYCDNVSLDSFTHEMGGKAIEFVGMEKISSKQHRLNSLYSITLNESLVSTAGDEVAALLGSCRAKEIHMCHTLVYDWQDIYRICEPFPHLTGLNLSSNFFKPYLKSDLNCNLPLMRSLILTNCRMSWAEIDALADLLPNLDELCIYGNSISEIQTVGFRKLETLDLSENPIASWAAISSLGNLENLKTLNLNNCGLTDVDLKLFAPPTERISTTRFAVLNTLSLSSNGLTNWRSVNEFNNFPSLEHLCLSGNPVMSIESLATSRQFVIAKIRKLKSIDRITIEPQERKGAEWDYIKRFSSEFTDGGSNEFLLEHPRFPELVKYYGLPEKTETVVVQTGILKNRILDLTIQMNGKSLSKKIPNTIIVRNLKALVARQFNVDARHVQLFYRSPERADVLIELSNDLRDLSFYSLTSGDTMFVELVR